MAAGSLLALLDDIASILDDVSVMTQVAAKKTAGVLGDDLALNAQQVAGVHAERELPVVWAVAKGSFLNKLILVPSALTISYFAPAAILPLLMAGGVYLCFEGFEKIAHKLSHSRTADSHQAALSAALADAKVDLLALEEEKIKGAIRTDFILSAEIIVIALGTVAGAAFSLQATVVSSIALLMTVGVYGLVAAIVKLDDLGLYLLLKKGQGLYAQCQRKVGQQLLAFAPKLMRSLTVIGTLAMFMVGGSIIGHGFPLWHHGATQIVSWVQAMPASGPALALIAPLILDAVLGLLVGGVSLALFKLGKAIKPNIGWPAGQ
jgi:predicted DNA repair protein MutK